MRRTRAAVRAGCDLEAEQRAGGAGHGPCEGHRQCHGPGTSAPRPGAAPGRGGAGRTAARHGHLGLRGPAGGTGPAPAGPPACTDWAFVSACPGGPVGTRQAGAWPAGHHGSSSATSTPSVCPHRSRPEPEHGAAAAVRKKRGAANSRGSTQAGETGPGGQSTRPGAAPAPPGWRQERGLSAPGDAQAAGPGACPAPPRGSWSRAVGGRRRPADTKRHVAGVLGRRTGITSIPGTQAEGGTAGPGRTVTPARASTACSPGQSTRRAPGHRIGRARCPGPDPRGRRRGLRPTAETPKR